MKGAPVHHLNPPEPQTPAAQRATLDLLAKMNEQHLADHPGESELDARIRNFELAARMQLAAGDVDSDAFPPRKTAVAAITVTTGSPSGSPTAAGT